MINRICIVTVERSGSTFQVELCPDCASEAENVTSVVSTTPDTYEPETTRCEGFKRIGTRTVYCDKAWGDSDEPEANFRHFMPSGHALSELKNCNARIALIREDMLNGAWDEGDSTPVDVLKSEYEYLHALETIIYSPNPALRMLARGWVQYHWCS